MAEAFKRLAQGYFASSSAKLYDVPSSTEGIIKAINISNNTSTAREVTLYHCDNGDTPDNEQVILPGVSIVAGGFAEWEGTLTMAATTELYGFAASAGDITYTIWGLEIS
jgi:hypothetical protein